MILREQLREVFEIHESAMQRLGYPGGDLKGSNKAEGESAKSYDFTHLVESSTDPPIMQLRHGIDYNRIDTTLLGLLELFGIPRVKETDSPESPVGPRPMSTLQKATTWWDISSFLSQGIFPPYMLPRTLSTGGLLPPELIVALYPARTNVRKPS